MAAVEIDDGYVEASTPMGRGQCGHDWQRGRGGALLLGIYAGVWCDACWNESGYRDEDASGVDPLDAGEAYGEDDY